MQINIVLGDIPKESVVAGRLKVNVGATVADTVYESLPMLSTATVPLSFPATRFTVESPEAVGLVTAELDDKVTQ